MDKYEVVIMGTTDKSRWTMTWNAINFAEAEIHTLAMLARTNQLEHNIIVAINRDYDEDWPDYTKVRPDGPETAKGGLIGQEPY